MTTTDKNRRRQEQKKTRTEEDKDRRRQRQKTRTEDDNDRRQKTTTATIPIVDDNLLRRESAEFLDGVLDDGSDVSGHVLSVAANVKVGSLLQERPCL